MRLEGLKIGLIEDDPIMGESLVQVFGIEGADVLWWRTGAEGLRALHHSDRDIIVCDIRLPDMSGDQIFSEARHHRNAAPFLFMTAFGDIEQAVDLLKSGAGDYVTKPFDPEDLIGRINGMVPNPEMRRSSGTLGPSGAMREIEQTLKRISATRMPVLLEGETGVGKEVCARFLHGLTTRDLMPFMAVNCAAIPEDRMEVELFGSHQSAVHRGFAEKAEKGTLYLDSIAELSPGLQPKLLRLQEEESFYRLGGDTPVYFEARTVSSTNTDLNALAAEGKFREDLLYRINTVEITIPPLHQRPDDIIWLAERFLREVAALLSDEPKRLSAAAEERLMDHAWPGNARELRNRVERANALTETPRIQPEDLFVNHNGESELNNKIAKLSIVRDAAEKRHIKLALSAMDGNVSQAAQTLGVSRTTMWEKMLKHGIRSSRDG